MICKICNFCVSVACSFMTFYARACHLSTRKSHMTARHGPFSSILPFSPGGASKLYQCPRRFARRSQAQAEQMPFLAPFNYSFPDMRVKTRSFRHDRASHPSSLRFLRLFIAPVAPVINTNDRRQGHMTVTHPIGPNICGLFSA